MAVKDEVTSNITFNGILGRIRLWSVAVVIRFLAYYFCTDFLKRRPELVVPQNSIRRLTDGIYLQKNGVSPYNGDMFHYQPIILYVVGNYVSQTGVLLAIFTVFDLITAEFLRSSAQCFLKQKSESANRCDEISNFVAKCYLLNPISIASCAVLSFSVFTNTITAFLLFVFLKGHMLHTTVILSFLTHLTLYPIILIVALFVRFPQRSQQLTIVAVMFTSFLSFVTLNFLLAGNWKYIDSTYIFLLQVRDLTPNVGIFWYFFIEVFDHFRTFFICVFQLNILVYVLPLAFTLRDDAFLLFHTLLILISVFSPYPSMSESIIYLSLLPVLVNLHKHIKWGLVVGVTLLVCTVLSPIMWQTWIITGSGNANFYFAVTLSYCTAQIFILTDVVSAYLRSQIDTDTERAVVPGKVFYVLK